MKVYGPNWTLICMKVDGPVSTLSVRKWPSTFSCLDQPVHFTKVNDPSTSAFRPSTLFVVDRPLLLKLNVYGPSWAHRHPRSLPKLDGSIIKFDKRPSTLKHDRPVCLRWTVHFWPKFIPVVFWSLQPLSYRVEYRAYTWPTIFITDSKKYFLLISSHVLE